MWPKWPKRAPLIGLVGSVLLASSAGLSLARPDSGMDSSYPGYEAAAPDNQDSVEVQAAPSVSIAAPSAAQGDFGASRGNVWDMNSTGDIVWTQSNASGQTIQLSQPTPGIVRGQVPEGSDLAIAFYASSSINLPSSQYHHLTYRIMIAAEGGCRTNGRAIYAKSWPVWIGSQVHTHAYVPHTVPMSCSYGQYCVYYMDLSSNTNDIVGPDYATWFSNPPPWPADAVKAFGIWPHERWVNCGGGPNYFDLDYVYLTGEIVAREKDGYKYTVNWNISDPDGGTMVSTIRYLEVDELLPPAASPACSSTNFGDPTTLPPRDPNQIYLPVIVASQSGIGGRWQDFSPVATKTTSTGQQTYQLDFSDDSKFEDGKSYYICVRVDDSTSQSYAVSSAPVIRVPHSPNFSNE